MENQWWNVTEVSLGGAIRYFLTWGLLVACLIKYLIN